MYRIYVAGEFRHLETYALEFPISNHLFVQHNWHRRHIQRYWASYKPLDSIDTDESQVDRSERRNSINSVSSHNSRNRPSSSSSIDLPSIHSDSEDSSITDEIQVFVKVAHFGPVPITTFPDALIGEVIDEALFILQIGKEL